ncbi:asparagine synthase (glutamine-hydrolyzing) [Pusillimonas sp. T2]|uniref:asparagine synthase (glutamine-hydrolyzing) n=1 Tax=Pusillimonas sp. T2 TaxID=1548123 RepID=UPI000B9C79F9|nr:asparagine synthase (glutamine-hydrolyzing) [Pusillimonas sp. T2]
MCGIVGIWQPEAAIGIEAAAGRMVRTLTHRGPDDDGVWVDPAVPLALAHRRLSILDLSAAGRQPMLSSCGRYVLVYNGEIYNHLDLRAELDATQWRGHSDTETLLACVQAWGLRRTLERAVGMFALALWDRDSGVLSLARDRVGEKPLFWGWQANTLLFGSELKALLAYPGFRAGVDRGCLALFLRHGYVPAPWSIYEGVSKLLPGHCVDICLRQGSALAKSALPYPYWSFNNTVTEGLSNPFDGGDVEAIRALESRLSETIGSQMLADVPVGAFFSGGIDSSTVVSLMQKQSSRPVRTFTIGFDGSEYDEAKHAESVARHLGTAHTPLIVRPEDALDVIPLLPSMYCEPLSADSQVPLYLISKLARQHVTVALSGDGGDELFGGYNRYLGARRVWLRMQSLPAPLRHAFAAFLRSMSPEGWDRVFSWLKPILPERFRLAIPGTKAQKLADVLELDTEQDYFRRLTSHWQDPASVVLGAREPQTLMTNMAAWPKTDSFEHWMMAMDAQTFLPDEVMAKVDRAAMAASLETRAPLLDHRVVELAWRMPLRMKIRDGQGKWLLRQVLYRHVPRELVERPKKGFGMPIDDWLRGPLRDWADNLLSEERLRAEGYFDPAPIRQLWHQHLKGGYNWQYRLWPILMFQAWISSAEDEL